MTSFGWKRKAGQNINKTKAQAFENNAQPEEDDDETLEKYGIDWLDPSKSKKAFTLEDAKTKSARLQQEGETLAEAERYWEAINKWDNALQLTPNISKLYEMKAQCLLCLNELIPAEISAKKAVECDKKWWVAYVTLGRTQMNIGEVKLAIRNFSKGLHLKPDAFDVWKDDLCWALELYKKHKDMLVRKELEEPKLQIKELDNDEQDESNMKIVKKSKLDPNLLLPTEDSQTEVRIMPKNMVKFRF